MARNSFLHPAGLDVDQVDEQVSLALPGCRRRRQGSCRRGRRRRRPGRPHRNQGRSAAEDADRLAGGQVPDAEGLVHRDGDRCLAVGRESGTANGGRVTAGVEDQVGLVRIRPGDLLLLRRGARRSPLDDGHQRSRCSQRLHRLGRLHRNGGGRVQDWNGGGWGLESAPGSRRLNRRAFGRRLSHAGACGSGRLPGRRIRKAASSMEQPAARRPSPGGHVVDAAGGELAASATGVGNPVVDGPRRHPRPPVPAVESGRR